MIYSVQTRKGEPIKIGYTRDESSLNGRLASLQTGHPCLLNIVTVFPGDMKLEREIHKRLEPHRINGEWFRHNEVVEDLLREYSETPLEFHIDTKEMVVVPRDSIDWDTAQFPENWDVVSAEQLGDGLVEKKWIEKKWQEMEPTKSAEEIYFELQTDDIKQMLEEEAQKHGSSVLEEAQFMESMKHLRTKDENCPICSKRLKTERDINGASA